MFTDALLTSNYNMAGLTLGGNETTAWREKRNSKLENRKWKMEKRKWKSFGRWGKSAQAGMPVPLVLQVVQSFNKKEFSLSDVYVYENQLGEASSGESACAGQERSFDSLRSLPVRNGAGRMTILFG